MAYFPFFIDIADKPCVIFGGGNVAMRKVLKLIGFGCRITVVAPDVCGGIRSAEGVNIITDEFKTEYAEGAFMVIAATDDPAVNTAVSHFCRKKGILVNVVDVKEECSFLFPALFNDGPITAGISTSGESPQTAKAVRRIIEKSVPAYMGDIAETLGGLREEIKSGIPCQKTREKVFAALFDAMDKNDGKISGEEIKNIIRQVGK